MLSNGIGTFAGVKFVTAGNQTLTATDKTNGSISGSWQVKIYPGMQSSFTVSAPLTVKAGDQFPVTVKAYDAYGNFVNADSGAVIFSSSDTTALFPAIGQMNNGVGTFTVILNKPGTQTLTVTDKYIPTAKGTSQGIAVTAAGSGGSTEPDYSTASAGR